MNALFPPDAGDDPRLPAVVDAGHAIRPGYGYPGVYEGEAFDTAQTRGRLILLRLLDLVVKYKYLIAGILVAALIAGYVKTKWTTPLYEAETTVQIDASMPKVFNKRMESGDFEGVAREPYFFETQYQILKSRSLAERVADSMNLASLVPVDGAPDSSILSKLRRLFIGGPEQPKNRPLTAATITAAREAAVGQIMGGLSVQPIPMSRIVRISFKGPDPRLAQKISVAVAENFVAANLDHRSSASTYARDLIQKRLQQLKTKLEESEKQVVSYAQKEGLVNIDEKQPETTARLSALNAALSNATAERIHNEQLWNQARIGNGFGLPQVLADHAVQTAREKRAQLMSDYKEKLNVLKPAFPEMVQLKSQITELDRQIKEQVDLVKDSIEAQFDASKTQQAALEKTVAQLRTQSLDLRSRSIEYNILQRELDTNKALYDGLLQQYKELDVTGNVGTNNITILDRAEVPGAPFSPRLSRNLLIALMLGVLCASAAIYTLELFDDTFKGAETIEDALGITTLGVIPLAPQNTNPLDEIIRVPNSAIAEAYRSLRTALQFSTESGAPRTLLVTSAKPGEGKSTTSISLATNFAQLGMRVLLIDADLRNPSIGRYFNIDRSIGLSNHLSGAASASEITQSCSMPNVSVITSGPLPPNPAELLAGARFPPMLAQVSDLYDIVIIDGPPVMGLADAPILSSIVAGTLIVIQAGGTRLGLVRAAIKRLRFARARIVGAVLSKFDSNRSGFSYRYNYSYSYDYNDGGRKTLIGPQTPEG